MRVIILAGGKGTRLKPFTNVIPKPLVPVGEMPILEIVLRQLKATGISQVTLAVSHMARLIEAFFGDGGNLGLEISYSLEDKILGTAGPLRLVEFEGDDVMVMNGDLLTTINYRDFRRFHSEGRHDISIATFKKEVKIDLGVLVIEDEKLIDYIEKPTYYYDVSMGIYCINRSMMDLIPPDSRFDMPELVLKAKSLGKKISCYSGDYEWLDIGRMDDYEEAVRLFNEHIEKYLP